MTRQWKPSALESAVRRWVDAVLAGAAEARVHSIPAKDDGPAVMALSAEAEATVGEIGRSLGTADHFQGPGALSHFLYDSLATILQSSTHAPVDTGLIATELLQRLASPLQRFRFLAPLSLRGDFSLSGPIGGPNALSLESVDREGQGLISLSGTVDAPTEPMAIAAIEGILESILGICIALDLCVMLPPLPGDNPSLGLYEIWPHDAAIPTQLRSAVAAGIAGAVFRVPELLTDFDRHHMETGHIERGLERHGRHLPELMASSDDRALELRRAGGLLLRAAVSADVGLALTYGFMCLEGLLLERKTTDNVLTRLSEAVAYRIGTSSAERARLRREVKDLYDVRSRYVHTGQAGLQAWNRPRERCLDIVGSVLLKEIDEAAP